ncbi:MAG: hypothetical protein WC657_00165 [Candidatus Paceibacterota bacterium]|jgi:hypothetical protein
MKFNLLKLKKKSVPTLKSLRANILDVDSYWLLSLGVFFVIFLVVTFIGLKLFYAQYFESYKKSGSVENYENLINVDKLKNAIEKRNVYINKEISLPRDPSM